MASSSDNKSPTPSFIGNGKEKAFLLRGSRFLADAKVNKDLAFTLQERQILGIHGLLPAQIQTQEHQVKEMLSMLRKIHNNMDRYNFLMTLLGKNEKLFYCILSEHIEEFLPVIYTPTIAVICQQLDCLYPKPKGLYVTAHDAGYIHDILCNWPESSIRAVVVSDGARVLGLGDMGNHGMGVVVSKVLLYTVLAGVKPSWCLPVTIDIGTNNHHLLANTNYSGLKHGRIKGKQYHALIDEFMEAVSKRYGRTCLVQFEDFSSATSINLIRKFQYKQPILCDDIQGTACVAVGGLLAALKALHKPILGCKIMIVASGNSCVGIANLLVLYMVGEGIDRTEAQDMVWVLDNDGLITKLDCESNMRKQFSQFAKNHVPTSDLLQLIVEVQPAILIGACGNEGVFTENVIRAVSALTDRPIIFALSNPHHRVECTAEEAYTYSQGNCVFASGCVFPPVEYNGQSFHPSQANSIYVFPGLALAAVMGQFRYIDDHMYLITAKVLAASCTTHHLEEGRVYPPISHLRQVSVEVASALLDYAYSQSLATHHPEPAVKRDLILANLYDHHYRSFLPSDVYSYDD